MRDGRPLALLVLAGAGLAGCGKAGAPAVIDLARLEVRGVLPQGEVARGSGAPIVLERRGDDLWLCVDLERPAWRSAEIPGRWRVELPVLALGEPRADEAPYVLEASGDGAPGDGAPGRLPYEADPERFGSQAGVFTTDGLDLVLQLEPQAIPPTALRLAACANYESLDEGLRRLEGRRVSGSGFWVPPGAARTIDLALPPGSVLRFGTLATAVLGQREARMAPQRFRVLLDGLQIFESTQESKAVGESLVWHRVELPRGGVRRARLSFTVEGPFAATAILGPMVLPARRERVADESGGPRPNVLVFLADTFRADNLPAYGAPPGLAGLTPRLDAFAAQARVFRSAWSVSTHTLPTHSSLFSGLFPPQNGQVDYFNPLPDEVRTLAELLGRAGYRCGAITDGVMVSRAHGLHQGFELFDERRVLDSLERTRAFLDADDGRPVFLFLQTYRVHAPYVTAAALPEGLAGALDLGREYDQLLPEVEALFGRRDTPPESAAERRTAADLRALYLAGVPDLDRLFGGFLDEVEGRGLTANGYVLFTSDHGEAFFEHGRAFHAGPVWEEELRVPLLLRGPGVTPGIEERPVSLIDFAPTLAALTGTPGLPLWEGRSLLESGGARPLYAFQSTDKRTLAVIEGSRKLLGLEDPEALRAGRWRAAFDLEQDPAELEDQLGRAEWPVKLGERRRAELLRLLEPLVTPRTARLTGEHRGEMQALGYGGEDPGR